MAGTQDVDIAWHVWEQLFKEKNSEVPSISLIMHSTEECILDDFRFTSIVEAKETTFPCRFLKTFAFRLGKVQDMSQPLYNWVPYSKIKLFYKKVESYKKKQMAATAGGL